MKTETLRQKYYEFFDRKLEEEFIEDFSFFTQLLDMSNDTIERLLKEFKYPDSKIEDCKITSYNTFCKSYKTEALSIIEEMPGTDIDRTVVSKDEAEKIAEEITVNSKINDLVNKKKEVSSEIAETIIKLSNQRAQVLFSKIGEDSVNNILKERMPEQFKNEFDVMMEVVKEKYDQIK